MQMIREISPKTVEIEKKEYDRKEKKKQKKKDTYIIKSLM